MGLSSYGKPRYLSALRELVREDEGFGFHLNLEAFPILKTDALLRRERSAQSRAVLQSSAADADHRLPQRKAKDRLEESTGTSQNRCRRASKRWESSSGKSLFRASGAHLALSGGCAHNSVWAGKITQTSQFKNVVVAPAAHDAGLAVGAAIGAAQVKVSPEGGHWACSVWTPEIRHCPLRPSDFRISHQRI